MRTCQLPKLSYAYNAFEPHISEEQLRIHHEKHHQAYVNGVNAGLEKLTKARIESADLDIKSLLKELSFNLGGHFLHSVFWESLTPNSSGEPKENLKKMIDQEFGSFERFKKEFTQAALSVEGSGWAVLVWDRLTERLLIMQIEKHNNNVFLSSEVLLCLDVFEHAYYLDYKNERAKFVEVFWKVVNFDVVEEKLKRLMI